MKTHGLSLFLPISFHFFAVIGGSSLEAGSHEARLGSSPTSSSAYVIDATGSLWAWGRNRSGELGVGFKSDIETTPTGVPVPAGESGWLTVAGGGFHALGISSQGRLYAWGNNYWGQVGVGITNASQPMPVPVHVPTGAGTWTAVAAGYWHSLGLAGDGQLYAWGMGRYGELGYRGEGEYYYSALPNIVGRPSNVNRWTAIAAGQGFSLALGDDGALYIWGIQPDNQPRPVKTLPPDPAKRWVTIAAGAGHTVALADDGKLFAWSGNSPVPVPFPEGVTQWTAVAAGDYHSLAMAPDGRLFAWGGNYSGQLGDGSFTNRSTPGLVVLPAGVTRWISFTSGREYNLAIGDDCRLYAWGSILISGGSSYATVPTPVSGAGDPCPSISRLSDGLFHLNFPGTTGWRFRIEGSTDLKNWTPVCTNVVTDGALHFVDPDSSDLPRRFYRTLPEADGSAGD